MSATVNLCEEEDQPRASCPIHRTHQRFLLRDVQCSQQYAPVYRHRVEQQSRRAVDALALCQQQGKGGSDPKAPQQQAMTSSDTRRVIDLTPGQPSIVVGVLYKEMKSLPHFLKEFQKELLRLDAGDDDDDDDNNDGEGEAMLGLDEVAVPPDVDGEGDGTEEQQHQQDEEASELYLEDSSGRVRLVGSSSIASAPPLAPQVCTGMVLAVLGSLNEHGEIEVMDWALSGIPQPRPSLRLAPAAAGAKRPPPCYIGFLSGFHITAGYDPRQALRLQLLVDFLNGNVGSEATRSTAARISRLVIGGNTLGPTEINELKSKVMLEPQDHVRLKLSERDNTATVVCEAASLMPQMDALMAALSQTVEVELMPGDYDISNAFLPQQPIHSLLLPRASRYSTLRMVTNPYEFSAVLPVPNATGASQEVKEGEGDDSVVEVEQSATKNGAGQRKAGEEELHFFVSAGQNVRDVLRQSSFHKGTEAMRQMLASGCASPTAPNTLWSYPFSEGDPFIFTHPPHCFVACEQPKFESALVSIPQLELAGAPAVNEEEAAASVRGGSSEPTTMVRVLCVPSFSSSGALVLVDVNSPTLETVCVDFSLDGVTELKKQSE